MRMFARLWFGTERPPQDRAELVGRNRLSHRRAVQHDGAHGPEASRCELGGTADGGLAGVWRVLPSCDVAQERRRTTGQKCVGRRASARAALS